MKIRTDFVTNSSSSAFIIKKKRLTRQQRYMLDNHLYFGELFNRLAKKWKDVREFDFPFYMDSWTIEEDDTELRGHTSMDNFGMGEFFEVIGIDDKHVRWSDDYHDLDTKYEIAWHKMEPKEIKRRMTEINKKKNLK